MRRDNPDVFAEHITQASRKQGSPSAEELDIDFDDIQFEDFQPKNSDHFRIAFAAHMLKLGDEARAYSRALIDCGVVAPPPEALKELGREYAADKRVQERMRTMRISLQSSYVDRLQDHIDKLAELRDMAMTEGKYAPAVAAEVARGKVQGFYDMRSTPEGDGDARGMGEDELKQRVAAALQRMEARKLAAPDLDVAEFAMREAGRDY